MNCLASLRTQTHRPDIFLVDNGSTNESGTLLSKELRPLQGETLLSLSVGIGFGDAVNLGVKHAEDEGYRFVYLAGNDTIIPPQAIESMARHEIVSNARGAVGAVLVYMDRPDTVQSAGGILHGRSWSSLHHGWNKRLDEISPLPRYDWLDFAAILIPVDLFRRVGGLAQDLRFYWEDVDWCVRATAKGFAFSVDHSVVVQHKTSGTAGYRSDFATYFQERNRFETAKKYKGILFSFSLLIHEWIHLRSQRTPQAPVQRLALRDFLFRRPYRF